MNNIKFFLIQLTLIGQFYNALAQDLSNAIILKDNLGEIKSFIVESEDFYVENTNSVENFFNNVIQIQEGDTFSKETLRSFRSDIANESYQQYYKGIKVEGGLYVFHIKNDHISYAHGNYVRIKGLNVSPVISDVEAALIFATSKGCSLTDNMVHSAELVIKQIQDETNNIKPHLVYNVRIESIDEVGVVDAQTGNLLHIHSAIDNVDVPVISTFHKLYRDTVALCTTQCQNGNSYRLVDTTRGNGIAVVNFNGKPSSYANYTSIYNTTNSNIWYKDNMMANNLYAGLDAHWAMQKFYDWLYDAYGINSIDNNGKALITYLNCSSTNTASWSKNYHAILVSNVVYGNRPYVSLDVIAHELGHGINQLVNEWGHEAEQDYLNEGLSDIWSIIMDYRTGSTYENAWKLGEEISSSCIRQFKNAKNIATYYKNNSYNGNTDIHFRGGLFPHWFNLLVEGYDDVTNLISVSAMGFDTAEQLIVNAIYGGYLKGVKTFADTRVALTRAAMDMGDSNLAFQVQNAWHAVGVGDRPMTLRGDKHLCGQAIYTLENPYYFPNCPNEVRWSISNNNLEIISGQGSYNVVVKKKGDGECTLSATIVTGNLDRQIFTKKVYTGIPDLGELKFYASDGGEGYWNGGNARNRIEVTSPYTDYYDKYEYEIYRFDKNWNTSLYQHFFNVSPNYEVSCSIGWYLVRVRGVNDCGYSEWTEGEVEMQDMWNKNSEFEINYDSSIETLTISRNTSSNVNYSNSYSLQQINSTNRIKLEIWHGNELLRTLQPSIFPCQIKLSNLKNGIYILRILTNDKSYSVKFSKY